MHHDPAILQGLPQLVGVQLVEVLDFYDGPLDGLALYREREYWFSAVPEWIRDAEPSEPRPLVLHEITAQQAAQVRAESRQFDVFANGDGNEDDWQQAWDTRSTYDEAPAVGWFLEAATSVE
ncbi:hypothetical protein [Micromonospora coxensis]|uniref:hypothetical protein n=1 Tax=Micromonospora coxensis TaxID=356852 RepID=UPI00341D54D6